jgi:hypothetical protein
VILSQAAGMVAQDLDDAALGYFAVATMFDHPLKLNL